jgi:NitT/TauT family transport system permease protein
VKEKIALVSILTNSILAGGKIGVGFLSGSIAILAEGLHSFMDIFSSAVGYVGIRISKRPEDKNRVIGLYHCQCTQFLTAVIFVHFKKVERILYPYIIALKIAPILALSPFIVLLFGIGVVSKIIIVIIVCFFPFLVNVVSGLQITDQAKLDLFHSLSASKSQIFFKLRLPNSLSYIFPALKLTSTLAITGAFVGEFIASNKGIGYVVLIATRTLKTETALAAITLIVVTGIMLFTLIDLLEKKILFWQKPN